MTEDGKTADSSGQTGAAAADQQPGFRILAQYVKDLSFENPDAPHSLNASQPSPKMEASVNVQAKQLAATDFECEIRVSVTAKRDEKVAFIVELVYAGIFQIVNLPQEQVQELVFIECPRQLFPFARRVIADATRDGGFPPLLLEPIDFVGLYQQQLAAAQKAAIQTGDAEPAPPA